MTLSARNLLFRLGIGFSFLCLVIGIAATVRTLPAYTVMEAEISRRSGGLFQVFAGKWFEPELLAVPCCILAMVLYSFFSIMLIYYFFEKTQSPEILFVVLFAASFSLEALRLILPLGRVYEIPSLYLLAASRIMLFSRHFGIFSLFTASVYAAGFKAQKQRNVILVITGAALFIALGIPIDTQTWTSSLSMVNGYASVVRFIEAGTFFITTISFLVTAWSRSSHEFIFIGMGAVFAFLGRNILLNTDTWAALPMGLLFLIAGTWLICTRLHKVYLWL